MAIDISTLSAVALGIGLSACCGFRVFIPLLAASIGAKLGWYDLATDMQWMAGWPALISFGSAAIVEVLAYYIPFVDNLLDSIATPLATVAGSLLAFSILPVSEDQSLFRWGAAIIAGGATAGTIQAGSGLIRLFSSKTTAGTGNAVVATGENAAAIGGTTLSFLVPILAAILVIGLVIFVLSKIYRSVFSRKSQPDENRAGSLD